MSALEIVIAVAAVALVLFTVIYNVVKRVIKKGGACSCDCSCCAYSKNKKVK